jgi:tetraacyldisaccharide 4'-kinase
MIQAPLIRALLYAPARLYEFVVRTRVVLYRRGILKRHRLRAPVISVGNLTVGGTGKTPCVAFLANFLRDEGHAVAILSRGYKRQGKGRVEVSNGSAILCGPGEAGDEPYLLARSCPGVRVIVDADRYAAGRWLEERAAVSIFILDDAFQHLRLERDLNLLLVDATEPLAEARLVPFGRLREPLNGLLRSDAVIVTRSDQPFDRGALEDLISKYSPRPVPVFYAYHQLTAWRRLDDGAQIDLASFKPRSVAAVSGIARPGRFIDDLSRLGLRIVLRRDFPDHHRYDREEFLQIAGAARELGAEAIVTTEKDAANLPADSVKLSAQTGLAVYAARIEFRCDPEPELKNLVREVVPANRA